jgi:hypothetical protein
VAVGFVSATIRFTAEVVSSSKSPDSLPNGRREEKKQISKKALDDMNETIKEEMPEWLATMDRYDDPDIEDMEDVWRY